MKFTPVEERNAAPVTTPAFVFEAIVKQLAIAASYNRGEVILAPHIIYTRHGEMYVDAITLERDGKPPREVKLGTFKLDGLGRMRVTARRFQPSALFDPRAAKYADATLMAIETEPA